MILEIMSSFEEQLDNNFPMHLEVEPLTPAWLARYATPPNETLADKKARLNRKRQAKYRHRHRSAKVHTMPTETMAVHATPPVGTSNRYRDAQHAHNLTSGINGSEQPQTRPVNIDTTENNVPVTNTVHLTQTGIDLEATASTVEMSSTIAWMARYATPEEETPAERTTRLKRKYQATYYRRRRALSVPNSVPSVRQTNRSSRPVSMETSIIDIQIPLRQRWETIRRQRLIRRHGTRTLRQGLGYHDAYIQPQRHYLGVREPCPYCAAEKWFGETGTLCCNGGQVILPPFAEPPRELCELFTNSRFMQNIRTYNNAFAFTSMGASLRAHDQVRQDRTVADGRGVYTYRVQGALCHRIGMLGQLPGRAPQYAQLYFHDSSAEEQRNGVIEARVARSNKMDRLIVATLQQILDQHNELARLFQHAYERMTQQEDVQLHIHARLPGLDLRRYNRPTADEIGDIFISNNAGKPRDIILQSRSTGGLIRVYETHQLYDAMHFPLLHPYGEVGWTFDIPKAARKDNTHSARENRSAVEESADVINEQPTRSFRQINLREYAAYRMCTRAGEMSLIHRAGRLMQQYAVDQCCKIEEQRLKYHRDHQAQLRADAYSGIIDFAGLADQQLHGEPIGNHRNLGQAGTRIILAPSFPGGDRFMRAQYQDSMAIVRAIGKPDLFITVTCNPKWPEVTEALLPRQQAADRPDLTVRVFRLKLKAIFEDLSAGVLGLEIAQIHVIEFQKHGLPHAHCLIILGDTDKPRSAADYDRLVSAEIPDQANEELYETVSKCMMHGPCGRSNPQAPCMKDGVCSKRFPKQYTKETRQAEDGYPVYRRRNDGRKVVVKGVELDNRYVVPYNPWLCHKYNCHINVEICASVASIKYLKKYLFKGCDHVAFSTDTQSCDEIQQYQDARYISASQAMWVIFGFEMQAKTVTVVQLPIHLEHQHRITFQPNENHRDRYTSEESDQNRILRALEQFQAFRLIEKYLRESTPSKTLTSISGMPQLADFHQFIPIDQLLSDQTSVNIHIDAERSYSINTLDETLASLHLLNVEQRLVYDVVTAAVDRHESEFEGLPEEHRKLFFLDGPDGTGKSFLLEKILAYTRRQSKIALAAASSGIAALLLTGGKTVHSTFKLPLALDENSTCNIPVQSSLANLMRQAALIV
uniref:uncharacterized protein LOC120952979 n=1 Tax=Anopheles coluzzii TaxID=1518534 RepID=UPI0020FFDA00|nr:uncharacterized protein LOC120952979 [Anopheles coluzzii]